nr:MAG TPA: hypothetical protein [Caudoviricetes sp.]
MNIQVFKICHDFSFLFFSISFCYNVSRKGVKL